MAAASSTDNRARRTRLEHDERRAQILSCARRLFAERSYDAVSTGEIAEAAGIARGLIHHYFGDKRGLYLEVVRSLAIPPQLFEGIDTADREAALYQLCDRWLDMAENNPKTVIATLGAEGFGHDPEVEAIVNEARARDAAGVIAILEPRPERVTPELRAMIEAYSSIVTRATVDWLEGRGLERDALRELLVRGVLALYDGVLHRVEDVSRQGVSPSAPRPS